MLLGKSLIQVRKYLIPAFYLILFSFLLFGMWEWLQSPFFSDISDDINTVVIFRFHCTLNDIVIVCAAIGIVSLFKRGIDWLLSPQKKDYLFVTLLGILYTLVSEHIVPYTESKVNSPDVEA